MTALKLLGRMLRLRKILRIKRFMFCQRDRQIDIWVKPYRNGRRCPECGRQGRIVRTMPETRRWRDVRVCGMDVYLLYQPREIVCPTHGRRQEAIPWAAPSAQVTYRLEYLVLRYCQAMCQKDAAQLLHMSPSTLSGILHRSITRIRDGHRIHGLKTVGIDEISYRRGKRYATIVYDLNRGRVVWVQEGKARESINHFFERCLTGFQRSQIRFACCDMSKAYIGAVKQWCPHARLVLDRFHIVKALNEAVDEVRKQQWRELKGSVEGTAVKGLRWLLFRHSSNRTPSQTRILKQLRKSNRRIWRAWQLKDEFERFWQYRYPGAARTFVQRWTTSALKSRLQPLRKFVNTLRNHFDDVLTFIDTHLTNATSEGINRLLRIVKNRASGFSHLDAFADIIYLVAGEVDIPDCIAAVFHTA